MTPKQRKQLKQSIRDTLTLNGAPPLDAQQLNAVANYVENQGAMRILKRLAEDFYITSTGRVEYAYIQGTDALESLAKPDRPLFKRLVEGDA